jgi:molybdopterin molybdotransferase
MVRIISAMVEDSSIQRITRLTPLEAVLALIDARVGAVKPRKAPVEAALGATLAEDVIAAERPPQPIALRDGFAVPAAAVVDAGPYTPVALSLAACRIDVGQPLPRDVDAVLPLDAVALRGDRADAVAAATAGEGVLPAGGDATPRLPLRRTGERLRTVDIAAIRAAGIADVTIRAPRIAVVCGGLSVSPVLDAALGWLLHAVAKAGAVATAKPIALDAALTDTDDDAVIAVGGTGSGRRDTSVQVLARLGRLEAHGVAVSPGETAAFGFAGTRPALLIPGRLDAVLAVWLLLGRHLAAKLAGSSVTDVAQVMPLKRKVASTIGLNELIPVTCADGVADPLASGYLSLTAVTRSDGWIVVPADSEGFAAATQVAVKPWP